MPQPSLKDFERKWGFFNSCASTRDGLAESHMQISSLEWVRTTAITGLGLRDVPV